jgi:predicted PurR-regulated permease PerM
MTTIQPGSTLPAASSKPAEPPITRVDLHVPFATILKLLVSALLVLALIQLWSLLILTVIAVLVAVTLVPAALWLQRRGLSHGWSVGVIALVILALVIGTMALLVPAMSAQVTELVKRLPEIGQRVSHDIPAAAPLVAHLQQRLNKTPAASEISQWMNRGLTVGRYAVEGLTAFLFVFVVSMYLLLEGKAAFAWLISFAPHERRERLRATSREVSKVILSYMRGQFITCVLCGAFALGVLLLLRVPAALPLAAIAFVFDLVPVVGTIIMMAAPALVALTISPSRALLVVAAYLFYHLLENYVIVPRVYGKQMRLSTLTVVLAVTVGGTLQGIIGAVLALPIAAIYPIIERIWLRDHLAADTARDHAAIESEDDERSENAANRIARGSGPTA